MSEAAKEEMDAASHLQAPTLWKNTFKYTYKSASHTRIYAYMHAYILMRIHTHAHTDN